MMKIISKLSAIHMLTRFLMILVGFLVFCTAMDTITFNNSLTEGGETLVSAGGRFELAFFRPYGSNINNGYIGIWYKSNPDTVVWVANRDQPLSDGSIGVFAIADNGHLHVLDGNNNKSYWSTNLGNASSKSARARLLDDGNLVLESEDTKLVWESFDHPTDTFLPGMKMHKGFVLRSWKSQADPAVGNFEFQPSQDDENQFIIMKGSSPYWKSRVSGGFIASNENIQLYSYLTINFDTRSIESSNVESKPKTINFDNITLPVSVDYNNTRLVLNFEGLLQIFIQRDRTGHWIRIWQEPKDFCSLFDACGSFASCNSYNQFPCKCLPGFKPHSLEKWNKGEFSEGCERISSICDNDVSGTTGFLKLKKVKVGKPDEPRYLPQDNETQCRDDCLGDCRCQAYSYSVGNSSGGICWFWSVDIKNIQELYPYKGPDLNVRVVHSDIETSKRSCETCGTNIIPYPLSTGSQCGDPKYNGFVCDNTSTGQVFFKVSNGSYPVTRINAESQTFSIQVPENCTERDWQAKSLPLDPSSPFFFRRCNMYDKKVSLNPLLTVNIFNEAEIQWNPPLEPLCNSTQDCNKQATCKRASDGMQRCLCNKHFQWDSKNATCIKGSRSSKTKEIPYLSIFLGAIAAILLVLCAVIYFLYLQKQRMVTRREKHTEGIQSNITASRLYDSEKRVKEFIDSSQFKEEDKKGIDVPFIDLESIVAATDDFSDANKLGQGGFGPVYKGKFPSGQEIAIKRLSSGSGQGLEEFKNEVVLIAKLQHRNLVRLLGYYVDRFEKMLLYEYMPNRSLDAFIFDRTLCVHLNWELRFNIIMGIARGLLYLHHDSRLRIIHRDLKTSNVLLDEDMTPKISDFGLARIFDGKQTEATTQRVVGTYGYMSPEYALDGFFSIKSDVFSFGVVLLEILSGKRNTAFAKSEQALNLLGYAWRLWREQRALDLMDNAIRETCNESEFVRCVNVGLLCVQEDPNERPTMSSVIFGLGSESATLPSPKEPAFIVKRSSLSGTTSSSIGNGVLELTATLEQGR